MTRMVISIPIKHERRVWEQYLGTMTEIRELKTEITGLRTDLKRFVERANQQHLDAGTRRC